MRGAWACGIGLVMGIVAVTAGLSTAHAMDLAAAATAVRVEAAADYPRLEALYRDIHAHPELGFQEKRTAARLAAEMRALGFEVTEGVGGTGLVAVYRNGAGPRVLVRTELDALPMKELTGLPYASTATARWNGRETFVAHSCGHDTHMAIWVGAAKALVDQKTRWRGELMFVAQPAEEGGGGARAMLADGLYTRFGGKPDMAFALHVGPGIAGDISYRAGPITSASDSFSVMFQGRGAHGSMPDQSIDPVLMASRFVDDVQSVISREKDPFAFGVVTVGSIEAGSAGNIIPDHAALRGTIRSYDDAVRTRLIEGVRRTAAAVAQMAGAPAPRVEFGDSASPVINDAALTTRTAAALRADFGERIREAPRPWTASEDFSEFTRAGVPGVYLMLGSTSAAAMAASRASGEPPPTNHSPYFAPDPEITIKAGVEAMTLAVITAAAKSE